MEKRPQLKNIQEARERIRHTVFRTPVLTNTTLNRITGVDLYFKCENFQKAGAFKFRGASNTLFSMSEEQARKGVVTHSSGNHAAALALAARNRGIPAYIVMPSNAPKVKIAAVEGYGGRIIFCEPTLEARENGALKIIDRTNAMLIHPYNDHRIIAGQGTAALELLEEVPDLEFFLAPVGGGGLLSGSAIAATGMRPGIRVVGCEPARADDARRSFLAGRIIPAEHPDTIADGLRTSLGDRTFPIIRELVFDIVTVEEKWIVEAMRLIFERMKIVVEPSSAVPLGALLSGSLRIKGKKTGIILSGGNVDFSDFFGILYRSIERGS